MNSILLFTLCFISYTVFIYYCGWMFRDGRAEKEIKGLLKLCKKAEQEHIRTTYDNQGRVRN